MLFCNNKITCTSQETLDHSSRVVRQELNNDDCDKDKNIDNITEDKKNEDDDFIVEDKEDSEFNNLSETEKKV